MKYDDASWHFGAENFPETSPEEYGGTHIALLMKWCFIKGWAGEIHLQEWPDDVARVINDEMPATEFLFKYCDGKLTDEDLNIEGNRFARSLFGDGEQYLGDYDAVFGHMVYKASEEEHDFARFSDMLEQRWVAFDALQEVQDGLMQDYTATAPGEAKAKPWWKIW